MQIKKFEAKTMAEALRKVKHEFGPDAVILSARSVKKEHGVLGRLWTPKVEVTAAKDSIVADNGQEELSTGTYNGTVSRPAYRAPLNAAGLYRSDTVQLQKPVNRPIRKDPASEPIDADSGKQAMFAKRLVQHGVDETLLGQLWQASAASPELGGRHNHENSVDFLIQGLENRNLVAGDLSFGDKRQKIVTLVGCSGVGKTTTLAKIASRQAGQTQKRVAFISLDYYRIAANAELQVYSRILGIPLAVASDQATLAEALERFRDCDLILIDTPGFIADHSDYHNVLSLLTSAGVAMDFYLALNASTREQEFMRTIKQLDLLPLTGLIFTKLDECHTCGHLLNLLLRTKIPVAFVTHGNRIPEDIETVNCERLVQIILKDESGRQAPVEGGATSGSVGGPLNRQERAHSPRLAGGGFNSEEKAAVYYVANKKTDLYHAPMCESAKRIKAANIEYFQTRAAAEQERYQPCRLCVLESSASYYAMPARYAV